MEKENAESQNGNYIFVGVGKVKNKIDEKRLKDKTGGLKPKFSLYQRTVAPGINERKGWKGNKCLIARSLGACMRYSCINNPPIRYILSSPSKNYALFLRLKENGSGFSFTEKYLWYEANQEFCCGPNVIGYTRCHSWSSLNPLSPGVFGLLTKTKMLLDRVMIS